ncbi:hypothetical protein HFP69_06965 [Streptomyces sp. ARC12]|uniref:DUF6895 family protein n=1 Tax=Streptomyces TaxID=1883 RepID=UPI002E0F5EEE|nr:hypothetical protein [Streptomyces sp. HB372]WSR79186.1 hypothetical protein OG274_29750 [Streptomyces anulatus]
MTTRTSGPDADGGTTAAGETVATLAAGTGRWLGLHAGRLDSPAGRAELPVTPRVKALLQLALLCRCWRKAAPDDLALEPVLAVVEHAWRRPDFPRLLAHSPDSARPFGLIWAALAPAGAVTDARRGVLDRLSADGYLMPRRKSPYLHLGTRFYAELAGVGHELASYEELYACSMLARADRVPVAELDVCQVTDTVFYLSDYGFRDTGLDAEARERALRVVERLTDHCVREGAWEYAAKLLLARHCLGSDPLRTPSGTAALGMLAGARSPDGSIPGKTARGRAPASAAPQQYFRWAYQPTLVTALTTLLLTNGRHPHPVPTTAPPTARRTR